MIICLLLLMVPLSSAAWESSGDTLFTMDDLVATPSCSVTTTNSVKFVIYENITISAGDTLLIDPGDSLCFVKVSPVIVLKINGHLLADGSQASPIVFTSNESSPDTSNWGRIEFENDTAGSIFNYCRISYAATGIICDNSALATISNVIITTVGPSGISLSNSSPTVRNCAITNFTGSGIICTGNSAPVVGGSPANSNIMYNTIPPTGFTFKNFTANTITATHNDWGIQDYVYIDSIIVDDDENPAFGEVIFIPLYDLARPNPVTDLAASLADTNLSLNWSAVTADTLGSAENIGHYTIYRDTVAHFSPAGSDSIAAVTDTTFSDSTSGIGDVSTNSYYVIVAVDDAGNQSSISNRVGEYDYALKTTTGTDYTWVVFCLDDTSLQMASDLEAHIEANSRPATNCYSISEWNPTAQTYTSYTTIPIPQGDFPIQAGRAYRVEVSVDAGWTLMGDVLPSDSLSFELKTTTGTDYTWISIPLELDSLQMASDLEAHIEANSSPATNCYTVSEWNATAQAYTSYTTIPIPQGDFPIQAGRAYRVEVSVDATWPDL